MKPRHALLVAVALLVTAPLRAQPREVTEARAHFQQGVALAQTGDVAAALVEFEAAYALAPHFSVLYNIGRAHADQGRPLEAGAAFRRYLQEGGERIPAERREQVLALIAAQERQVGQLSIEVGSPMTRVWLDGVELDATALGRPVSLKSGRHSLLHSSEGAAPVQRSVEVPAAGLIEVQLPTTPNPAVRRSGLLGISCAVPAVAVEVVGAARAETPVREPIILPAGTYRVRASRPGYVSPEQTIEVTADRMTRVDCAARVAASLSTVQGAYLMARPSPVDAIVVVDGAEYRGSRLPAGPHHVQIARDGFVPRESTVVLAAGRTLIYESKLEPTPATKARWARHGAERRRYAYVLGGAAAAMLVTSGALYLWNAGRYEHWQSQPGATSDVASALSIQRVDDLSLGLLLGGVAAGASSAVLFAQPAREF